MFGTHKKGRSALKEKERLHTDKLCCWVAVVPLVLEFKGAAASTRLQVGALVAFVFDVVAFAQFYGEGVVPDLLPRLR